MDGAPVPPAAAAPPGLLATASRLGTAAWWEERCFEVLGAWSTTAPEAEVAVHLAAVSRHHAWRAEVLVARLPRLREVATEALLVPPGAAAAASVADLAGVDGSVARLAAVQRVLLPRLHVTHTALLAAASPVADAPLQRWLTKVADDVLSDWSAGEPVLQGLLGRAGAPDEAARTVATLDGALGSATVGLPLGADA